MGTHSKRASKGNGDYGIKPSAHIIYGADTFFGIFRPSEEHAAISFGVS